MTEQLITKVVDGVNPNIEASVIPLGMLNAVVVALVDGAGSQITTFTVNTAQYILYVDEASATITYIGEAVPGTAVGAASWRIKRIDTSSGTNILYADGNSNFDNIWNNRVGLSYS